MRTIAACAVALVGCTSTPSWVASSEDPVVREDFSGRIRARPDIHCDRVPGESASSEALHDFTDAGLTTCELTPVTGGLSIDRGEATSNCTIADFVSKDGGEVIDIENVGCSATSGDAIYFPLAALEGSEKYADVACNLMP
ncbi:MAG: hypothetical protein ABI183_22575 [Polyangiaceae bacterium]